MSNTFLEIPNLPFCLGATLAPENPAELPNVYPFRLEINNELGRLEQAVDNYLEEILKKAYRVGNEMGTPSNDTELGRPYVEDFMRFINEGSSKKGALLEIGAGTGFLSKRLLQSGWTVTSIEPGAGYEMCWKTHGVTVVNDFFPSKRVSDQFDAIVFYTVLEHIKDTKAFLTSVKQQLKPGGRIFLAVPDCTIEISEHDPSILLHEHFNYFTASSLANTLSDAGFLPVIESGRYGRSLFAIGVPVADSYKHHDIKDSLLECAAYISNVPRVRSRLRDSLESWLENGSVGMYCPSRLLNIIPVQSNVRFYDDAPEIQGKYYPPFRAQVGGRKELMSDPPGTLLIGSRTFGNKLKDELLSAGLRSKMILLGDLI